MTNTGFYILGILSGLVLYKLIYFLYTFLLLFDFTPLYPYLESVNYWCMKLTTKNIVEMGIILLIVIPISIFVIRERRKYN